LSDDVLWIYFAAILLFTSIASGIYPSLYISKFQVVGILKGSLKFGNKNPVTKVFLGLQLILACIFITSAVMFTQNSNYLAKRSWGYHQGQALYARIQDQLSYEKLSSRMAQHPDVLSISGSGHHLGKNNATTVLHFPDREYEVDRLAIDARYFETMGIPLLSGRIFNDHEGSDRQSVVVNELLASNLGWGQPVGQQFMVDSIRYEVVGVVKNFHNYDFYTPLKPTIFTIADKTDYRYLSVKARRDSEIRVYKALQSNWAELFPEIPFDGGFQEDVWGNYFQEIGNHGKVWKVLAFIAVVLASLGLYGLMTLNIVGRRREFSIRKVLGAEVRNIAADIAGQYVALFAVALTIGAPVSYMLIKLLFDASFAYHMPVNFFGAAFAVATLILVLVITVATQIRKVLRANPVDGLKVE
jgi:ABC-type antimicrobial peptide transport system permease subunit